MQTLGLICKTVKPGLTVSSTQQCQQAAACRPGHRPIGWSWSVGLLGSILVSIYLEVKTWLCDKRPRKFSPRSINALSRAAQHNAHTYIFVKSDSRRGSHFGETIQSHLVLKWPQVDFKSPTWNQNDLTWLGKKVTNFRLEVDLWHAKTYNHCGF